MSRGPGRIERAIEEAFTRQPQATFTVADLGAIAYPGLNFVEKRHRVAILRAADKVAARLWWVGLKAERPGGFVVYCNTLDVRSYALGRLRADHVNGMLPLADIESLLDEPEFGSPLKHRNKRDLIVPGGAWWHHVEMAKARKAGDEAESHRLYSALCDGVERRMAADRARRGERF